MLFVDPGDKVYVGHDHRRARRDNDLEVNPMKAKQLTNFRAAGKDEAIRLTPPRRMTLEQAIAYIEDDELVEVTPNADPPAQALPRPARAQEARAPGGERGGVTRSRNGGRRRRPSARMGAGARAPKAKCAEARAGV